MSPNSIEIRNIACLATPLGSSARRGRAQGEIRRIRDAALRAENGRLVFVGTEKEYLRQYAGRAADVTLEAAGKTLLPGLVDAHTHPVWVGDRGEEIGRRLAGESYATIAAEGGGILATVRATRKATDSELGSATARRLARIVASGTTTVKAKSGYGLTAAQEIRALRLLKDLHADGVPHIVPTLLAAHEIPPEFEKDRGAWVRSITDEILPAVAKEKLARFCDVFCDQGAFTVEESRTILSAAKKLGLKLRIHADELALTGGARLAAELDAASADHLLCIGDAEIAALSGS